VKWHHLHTYISSMAHGRKKIILKYYLPDENTKDTFAPYSYLLEGGNVRLYCYLEDENKQLKANPVDETTPPPDDGKDGADIKSDSIPIDEDAGISDEDTKT